MKLDASSPLKGIMFRRPRVILKTRQFIGLSVCLQIQEGTAWNSQVTLKHWSFSGNDKFPEGAKLCKNSFVERKVPRRLCVLLWRCCPIWVAENPSGSAVCELPDQRCTNNHLKSHKNTFFAILKLVSASAARLDHIYLPECIDLPECIEDCCDVIGSFSICVNKHLKNVPKVAGRCTYLSGTPWAPQNSWDRKVEARVQLQSWCHFTLMVSELNRWHLFHPS